MIRPFTTFLACLAAFVSAQDASTSRSLRLLYVQAPDDAPAAVFLVAGKEAKEIDLPRLSLSTKRLALPAGPVRVYAATKAPTKADPLPADAPFVDIPDGMNDPLVVILPLGGTGPLAFRMLPVEFSRTKAPEGAVLWFNLSARTVFAKLGAVQATVAPRQSVVQTPPGRNGDVYHVLIDVSPEAGETDNVPLMRSSWVKEPGQRHLLFVVPDPSRKVPRIVAVPDRMEPLPEPEAAKGAKTGAKAASGKPAK